MLLSRNFEIKNRLRTIKRLFKLLSNFRPHTGEQWCIDSKKYLQSMKDMRYYRPDIAKLLRQRDKYEQ